VISCEHGLICSVDWIATSSKFTKLVPSLFERPLSIANRLKVIMIATPLFFMARVPLIVLTQVYTSWRGYWWFDLLYFSMLEFVPLLLLVGVLRMSRGIDVATRNGGTASTSNSVKIASQQSNSYSSVPFDSW